MPIVAKLDELGKPAWIVLMILGFWFWWPLGLATLAFIYGSGRMSCWNNHHGTDRWQRKMNRMDQAMERMQAAKERIQEEMDRVRGKMGGSNWWGNPPSSGNRAFDEYRTETLRRLEDEQKEFRDFLDRLRVAKDKTEFDAFMAERRNRVQDPGQTGAQPQG
jgi:Protein of unknown function (DUF2852)